MDMKVLKKLLVVNTIMLMGCQPYLFKHRPLGVTNCSSQEFQCEEIPNLLRKTWSHKTPLKGGLSDATIYKVTDDRNAYVIRHTQNRNQEDRTREIQAQKIASDCAYGPHVYAYDATEGKIVMSFLQAEPDWQLDPAVKAHKLAMLLKKMHEGPAFCEHAPLLEQIQHQLCAIKEYPKDIELEKLLQVFNTIETLPSAFKMPTHGDLNPNNIIFTNGDYKLIDFESSGQDDPYFDLATIIIFNFANTPHEIEFLTQYFGHVPDSQELERVGNTKKAVYLFYGAALLSRVPAQIIQQNAPVQPLPEIFKAIGEGKFSLENETDLLIFAKSFLSMATQ